MDIKAIAACMKTYVNEQIYISEGNIILSGNEEIIKQPVVDGVTHQKLTYTFVNHAVKVFAHEQGIIFSKQITGYKDLLLKEYDYILYQIPVGSGKSGAYIKKGLSHNGYIRGQSSDHLCELCHNIQHPLNETMQKRNRYKEIINP